MTRRYEIRALTSRPAPNRLLRGLLMALLFELPILAAVTLALRGLAVMWNS